MINGYRRIPSQKKKIKFSLHNFSTPIISASRLINLLYQTPVGNKPINKSDSVEKFDLTASERIIVAVIEPSSPIYQLIKNTRLRPLIFCASTFSYKLQTVTNNRFEQVWKLQHKDSEIGKIELIYYPFVGGLDSKRPRVNTKLDPLSFKFTPKSGVYHINGKESDYSQKGFLVIKEGDIIEVKQGESLIKLFQVPLSKVKIEQATDQATFSWVEELNETWEKVALANKHIESPNELKTLTACFDIVDSTAKNKLDVSFFTSKLYIAINSFFSNYSSKYPREYKNKIDTEIFKLIEVNFAGDCVTVVAKMKSELTVPFMSYLTKCITNINKQLSDGNGSDFILRGGALVSNGSNIEIEKRVVDTGLQPALKSSTNKELLSGKSSISLTMLNFAELVGLPPKTVLCVFENNQLLNYLGNLGVIIDPSFYLLDENKIKEKSVDVPCITVSTYIFEKLINSFDISEYKKNSAANLVVSIVTENILRNFKSLLAPTPYFNTNVQDLEREKSNVAIPV